MPELTVPDVIHRLPPLVEEARRFLAKLRPSKRPRIRVWRGARRGFGAVYPGSFDPWTRTHEAILRATLRRGRGPLLVLLALDTVNKPAHAAPLAERLAILALHFASDRRVSIGVSTHGRFLEKARALGRATFVVGEDTKERVLAPRYYEDPERELAELHRRARFIVAPRGGRGDLRLSRVDQARSATQARRALAKGKLPWDQLAPDVLLACWQLRLYGNPRLLPVWVVTAFLERGGLVLLVKRSQQVGTHRGAWSGVSGYLDWPVRRLRQLVQRGPGRIALRQALQEVREETGIGRTELSGYRAGEEVPAPDPRNQREWRIRPFRFRLRGVVVPKLDWENVECDWVPLPDVARRRTVPRLSEALESACGPWRRWYRDRIAELEHDRESGAMEIARTFLGLGCQAREFGVGDMLVSCARRLARAHPMGPLKWIQERLVRGRSPNSIRRELRAQMEHLVATALRRLQGIRALATYGYSSTVGGILAGLGWDGCSITVSPDEDGHSRRLVESLRRVYHGRARLSSRVPSDAVMVIGCDAVLPDGSIINARGTVKAIRDAGLPVVVLAQKCKFVKRMPRLRRGFERVPYLGWTLIS